ncbi:MAG: carbon-nitrogen hydrolase family protein [Acidobacteriota bacterium]|jgi:omega-amidase
MRVYLSRWICRDVESNLKRLREESSAACRSGADFVMFPESFLHGYTRRLDASRARDVFTALSAAHPDVVFAFGSMTEDGRNRMTVWRRGAQIAFYDKVHLFEPNGEFDIWSPGESYAAVRTEHGVLGLMNCNDLRFPEQARTMKLKAGVTMLAVPAWWPWRRDHVWRTLLRARAIENHAWVMGCCVAASEFEGEYFSGAGNYVFDPHGDPVPTSDDHTYVLDLANAAPPIVDPVEKYRCVDRVEVFDPD